MTGQDDVARVCAGLSEAQRDWLLSLEPREGEQERDYATVFDVPPFVEIAPEERCPETGCLLVPGDRLWLGSHGCVVGGRAWSTLSPAGLAVRTQLMKEAP